MSAGVSLSYTRDAKVPLSNDDREMDDGWQCMPPAADGGWVIVDASKDNKTGWCSSDLQWGHG
jgi:hypothetical protein